MLQQFWIILYSSKECWVFFRGQLSIIYSVSWTYTINSRVGAQISIQLLQPQLSCLEPAPHVSFRHQQRFRQLTPRVWGLFSTFHNCPLTFQCYGCPQTSLILQARKTEDFVTDFSLPCLPHTMSFPSSKCQFHSRICPFVSNLSVFTRLFFVRSL